jgi:hypothetical protein
VALTVMDRATRLRDAILETKLTAPDPWTYTAKARAWAERAQQMVDRLASGQSAGLERELQGLAAEVEGDRDYQEARRRA